MWERHRPKIYGLAAGLVVSGSLAIMYLLRPFSNNPTQPDAIHTIPAPLRGVGTVYLSPGEYWPIGLIVDAGVVIAALLLAGFIYDAWRGFKNGWTRR